MRIVDADNIKNIICRITNDAIEKNQTKATIQKRLIMAVEKMPTLDVRKDTKGEWITDKERLGYWISTCSVCGHIFHGNEVLIYKPKFCSNCGANMKGGE